MTHHNSPDLLHTVLQLLTTQGTSSLAEGLRLLLDEAMRHERAAVLQAQPQRTSQPRIFPGCLWRSQIPRTQPFPGLRTQWLHPKLFSTLPRYVKFRPVPPRSLGQAKRRPTGRFVARPLVSRRIRKGFRYQRFVSVILPLLSRQRIPANPLFPVL